MSRNSSEYSRVAMKSVLIFASLLVVSYCGNDDFAKIDSVNQEQPCIQSGGYCVFAEDCPKDSLTPQKGLCPRQQCRGVECCYGLSEKETRCQKRGGECKASFCNDRLIFKKATDCPTGTKCCILVR